MSSFVPGNRMLMRSLAVVGCIGLGSISAFAQHGPKKTPQGSEGFAPARVSDTKRPCPNEKDCATEVKLKDGTVVGSVVSRGVSDSGVVEEYVKDTTEHFYSFSNERVPPLTWSPEAPRKMSFKEAWDYCASKKDLGLEWRLPTKLEFQTAFYPNNPDTDKFPYNKRLLEVLDMTKGSFLWGSTGTSFTRAWGFYGSSGYIAWVDVNDFRYYLDSARCVGR